MEKTTRKSLGFHKNGKIYIIDNTFDISEEMERRILLMEDAGKKEGKVS